MIVPEQFIEEHLKICHRTGDKKWISVAGRMRRKNERSRKRECAKKLYRSCLKLGIEPTPVREEYAKQYDKIKGIA